MKYKILSIVPLLGTMILAQNAKADIVNFSFTGAGVSGQGTLTYTPQSSGAGTITDITGTFSDSNPGLNGKPNIVNSTITGLYSINPVVPLPVNVTAPDFSLYPIVNGVPAPPASQASTALSYDNNYYPAGSPIVCTDYPFSGGLLDSYGLMFTLSNNDVVGLWSNGIFPGPPDPAIYGVAVADPNNTYDYIAGVTLAVPEPTTLALLALIPLTLRRRKQKQIA